MYSIGSLNWYVRFLRQGLALRGHDEYDESTNQGNFSRVLKFLAVHNKEIDVVGKNAPRDLKVTSPDIQHTDDYHLKVCW